MNIRVIRLTTGEDIIADVEYSNDFIELKNAVQVTVMPQRMQSSGSANFGFIPFPLTSSAKSIKIDRKFVMFDVVPLDEFVEQYNQLFTNIITPPNGLIV